MDFSINFVIDTDDLKDIKAAKQRINLAKPLQNETTPSVIWLSLDPFESTEVQWSEEYGIYASTDKVVHGNKISRLSDVFPAVDGTTYPFSADDTFSDPASGTGVARGTFGAENDVPHTDHPMLTFGLTQTALVNQAAQNRKPLSATLVLATESIQMTPFTIVYAWLDSEFQSETMITKVTGNAAVITLGGGVTDVTYKYNPGLGLFMKESNVESFASAVK